MNSCTTAIKQENSENEDRLTTAKTEKLNIVTHTLAGFNLQKSALNILFVAYKNDDKLELYAKSTSDSSYQLIKDFTICTRSGTLGPKKAEGDKQVPEGFYHINRFNPKSLYYLSLGINYPNELDQSKGYTGSDIFIHGKCETVGCLPMTDDLMKEIYLYAEVAKESGQLDIPVYIFPFYMSEAILQEHLPKVNEETKTFWKNLKTGFDIFHLHKKALNFTVDENTYVFQ